MSRKQQYGSVLLYISKYFLLHGRALDPLIHSLLHAWMFSYPACLFEHAMQNSALSLQSSLQDNRIDTFFPMQER